MHCWRQNMGRHASYPWALGLMLGICCSLGCTGAQGTPPGPDASGLGGAGGGKQGTGGSTSGSTSPGSGGISASGTGGNLGTGGRDGAGGAGGQRDASAQVGSDGSGSKCTGKTGSRRGKTNRTLTAAGLDRAYIVYEPEGLDANRAAPLVFVHHGFTMSGQAMFDITEYSAIADREGFVVAFPDGEPMSLGPWNVGTDVCGAGSIVTAGGDDFAFLDAMIDDIETDQCLDRAHVFVTGFSMGGYFSHHVGCMRADIAAVAPHSGGTHPFDTCVPGPKPVIIFHGTADPLISQSCDDTARAQWVERNHCSKDVVSKDVKGGHCEWSQGCPPGGQVVYCLFDGMGHVWAGGASGQMFGDPNFESASELSWSFFKNYGF
jgi:polyhydroxybutyrate depolymerase